MPLFESPVGIQHERNAGTVWGSAWTDRFNKFGDRYEIREGSGVWSRHTGVDLNLIRGQDENAQIYSIGDGWVTYADIYPDPKTWGGLVIIYHSVIDNRPVFSRYAHVQGIEPSIFKKKLVKVTKGQPIARIGGRELGFDPHLHFDISVTDVLDGDHRAAGYWPGDSLDLVNRHFVDPLDWLRNHQQMTAAAIADPIRIAFEGRVAHPDGAQVRKDHSLNAEFVKNLEQDSTLVIKKDGWEQDGYLWGQVSGGSLNDFWVRMREMKDENSDVAYIERLS